MTTNSSKGASSVFSGFAMGAMGLGLLLGAVWIALWVVEAAGGPDLRMPMRLLQSAGGLVLTGLVLRWLLQARDADPASGKDKD